MSYIAGYVFKNEKAELERRGWEFEAAPKELIPDETIPDMEYVMVWVDIDLFEIMDGPDWEKG